MPRISLTLTSRFVIVLATLLGSLGVVAWIGVKSLGYSRSAIDALYKDNIRTADASADLADRLGDARVTALNILLAPDAESRGRLNSELLGPIAADVNAGISSLRRAHGNDAAGDEQTLSRLADHWQSFVTQWAATPLPTDATDHAPRIALVYQQLGEANDLATKLVHVERDQAARTHAAADHTTETQRRLIYLMLVPAIVLTCVVTLRLMRSVLSRTLSYAHFARGLSEGDYAQALAVEGSDEISQLGRTLQDLAGRRHGEVAYEDTQLEFTDTMQLTATEDEAHALLRRHLERSISDSRVTVLNRNNSANRLEAVTEVDASSALRRGLVGALPRSCLAVRFARPHEEKHKKQALLTCDVCSQCENFSRCTPLLVGGEVIGSVLVQYPSMFTDEHERRVRESITQAAPVLANLRNLAIAELRAATDGLTGLPNRRAIQDTIRRMAAQALRSGSPLAMLMFDLDHFKQINDTFGHGKGDEALAAVGAALTSTLRDSDFPGRYGGEEFLVLLPDTDVAGAVTIAQRIQSALAEIFIPGLDRRITSSIGVAVLPVHASDADALERAADRALYQAKGNGRDRIEMAMERRDNVESNAAQEVEPRQDRAA